MEAKENAMRSSMRAYDVAHTRYRQVAGWCRKFKDNDINGVENLAIESKILRSVAPGIYEHWKSTQEDPRFYAALGVHIDCTTPGQLHEPAVRYCALYGKRAGRATARDLVHPLDGFLVPLFEREYGETMYTGPRFVLRKAFMPHIVAEIALDARPIARCRRRQDVFDMLTKYVY